MEIIFIALLTLLFAGYVIYKLVSNKPHTSDLTPPSQAGDISESECLSRRPTRPGERTNSSKVHASHSRAPARESKHTSTCPICELELKATYTREAVLEKYEYDDSKKIIAEAACPFCKNNNVIVETKKGNIEIRDPKWDAVYSKYDKKTDELQSKIDDIEDKLDEHEDAMCGDDDEAKALTDKQLTTLNNRLEKLTEQLDKVEDAHSNRDEKYEDRKSQWIEKAENKFG